ncbi:MAG: class I SAM-dependent methyltransferase [Patescibacteria group bacterium]
MNIKDTYNKIAEDWHRTHKDDDWWVSGTEHFCSLLPKGSLVLDVGCGGGVKSKYFIEKGMTVVGADLSENMISIAKREVPQARFATLDARDIDTLPETFDGIFAQAVLLHIPKKEIVPLIKKFKEKIKEGGYLYVAVKEQRADKSEEEIKDMDDYGYPYELFFSYFTQGELEQYFSDAGFEVVSSTVTPSGRIKWIQIVGRKLSNL